MAKALGPVLIKSLRSVSSPAENMTRITPISAIFAIKSDCCTRPRKQGPIINPAIICPATCGALHFLAIIPHSFAEKRIIARSRNISYVSMLSVLSYLMSNTKCSRVFPILQV